VHLIASGVVSVADADSAVAWGPGLRWGIMGPTQLFHLGGGQGGIEHFFEQFTGPMTALGKEADGLVESGTIFRHVEFSFIHVLLPSEAIKRGCSTPTLAPISVSSAGF